MGTRKIAWLPNEFYVGLIRNVSDNALSEPYSGYGYQRRRIVNSGIMPRYISFGEFTDVESYTGIFISRSVDGGVNDILYAVQLVETMLFDGTTLRVNITDLLDIINKRRIGVA